MQISKQPVPWTNETVIIDYAHSKIHSGDHFFYTDCITLASAGAQDYMFTNTTKYSHLSFDFSGSAITSLDIYEAGDRAGTTLQNIFNNYRNSIKESVNIIHKSISSGTTDGTKIWCHKGGSATNQSSGSVSSGVATEIILKLNTKYIFRFTSGTNDNLVNFKLAWYE
jgi:hypothetical protein